MKEEINSYTIIVRDFNTPLTTMDRSTKQNAISNIMKEILKGNINLLFTK